MSAWSKRKGMTTVESPQLTGASRIPREMTRREYLMLHLFDQGVDWWLAQEAVSSTAIEHPEWDMDEQRTWEDWANE